MVFYYTLQHVLAAHIQVAVGFKRERERQRERERETPDSVMNYNNFILKMK